VSNIQAQDRSEATDIQRNPEDREASLEMVHAALDAAYGKKAMEPVVLEVGAMCSYAEFVLMVSGRSDRQVDAIADAVIEAMKERGVRPLGVEGRGSGQWVLCDFGDLVVHVFHHPLRSHYDLESLWIDAPRIEIEIPDDARIPADEYY
jgi:ribosome-associated protein